MIAEIIGWAIRLYVLFQLGRLAFYLVIAAGERGA